MKNEQYKNLSNSILEDRVRVILEHYNKITYRQREIVKFRFGLKDGEAHTLEETGKEFGVTRERIRQIEAKVLEIIEERVFNDLKIND